MIFWRIVNVRNIVPGVIHIYVSLYVCVWWVGYYKRPQITMTLLSSSSQTINQNEDVDFRRLEEGVWQFQCDNFSTLIDFSQQISEGCG